MPIQRGVDKWKLKKWFTIIAPKLFNEVEVTEMPANDDKAVLGRNVVVGLEVLTGNPAHAYTNVTLKVVGVNGNRVMTELIKTEVIGSYIRSFIRRNKSIAHAILPVTTKDNKEAVVKLIAITKIKTTSSKIKSLRKAMSDFTINYFKENSLDSAIQSIISGQFQSELGAKVNNIVDLSKLEVRKLELKSISNTSNKKEEEKSTNEVKAEVTK
ncbi:MAG: hypothetical protein ACP5RI_01020 [Candidatus Micrarchaeia archaeon]